MISFYIEKILLVCEFILEFKDNAGLVFFQACKTSFVKKFVHVGATLIIVGPLNVQTEDYKYFF